MKKNIGKADKWIRIIFGLAILSIIFFVDSKWRWLGLLGLIPLITGIINYCPIYALLGISTNKSK